MQYCQLMILPAREEAMHPHPSDDVGQKRQLTEAIPITATLSS
jgi:hypothetical protein